MRRATREEEFTAFYGAYAPALRRTAFVVVRDWHLAEDLTQQALAKLYVAWPRVRADTRLAYARRVVVNECLSHLRRRRPEDATDRVPDRPVHDEPASDVGVVLDGLPPRQRAVIALRFLDDLAVTEVADLLGVSAGTVKSQTARALDTLRARLPHLNADLTPDLTPRETR